MILIIGRLLKGMGEGGNFSSQRAAKLEKKKRFVDGPLKHIIKQVQWYITKTLNCEAVCFG